MCEVGQELPAGVFGVFERVGHGVERAGEVGEFVVGRGWGRAGIQVAGCERVGSVGEVLDGLCDPGGQQPGHRSGGDCGGPDADDECEHHRLAERGVEVAGDDVGDGADGSPHVVLEDRRCDQERDDAEGRRAGEDHQELADEQPP